VSKSAKCWVVCVLLAALGGCAESRYPESLSTPNNWRLADARKTKGDEQHDLEACKRDATLYHAAPYSASSNGLTNSFIDCMKSKGYEYAPAP
jgi:hypothetical protein